MDESLNAMEKLAYIIANKELCSIYEEFLVTHFAWENFGFMLDVERYQELQTADERRAFAAIIYDKFLDSGAPFELGDVRVELRQAISNRIDEAPPKLFNNLLRSTSLALAHSTILDFELDPVYEQYQALKHGQNGSIPLEFDHVYKLILVGDSSIGKTSLMNRFVRNKFEDGGKATTGPEFAVKTLEIEKKVIKAQIWDTSGQEKFNAITKGYYRAAVGALLVYDVTKQSTFDNCHKWLNELKQWSEGAKIILVGNKTDLAQRQVATAAGQNFANDNNLLFIETSALDNSNVSKAFENLLTDVYHYYKSLGGQEYSSNVSRTVNLHKPDRKSVV